MNTDEHGYLDSLTERVLGAVFEVSNTLGAGFLEKVYEHALIRELALRGIRASAQASLAVTYKRQHVGEYFADILVEDNLGLCGKSLSTGGKFGQEASRATVARRVNGSRLGSREHAGLTGAVRDSDPEGQPVPPGRRRAAYIGGLGGLAASRSGAAVLYTEDLHHGQQILGVQIHNPFAELALPNA